MALILAVEPNGRQAAYLTTVLRARPRTELVIADSARRALEALGTRVPDVLLTSALLAPHDAAALSAWLRDLGPAAAHVQELTIPILATQPEPKPKRRGVMSALRRERPQTPTSDGCRPDVFADQVSTYVERAAGERKATEPEPQAEVEPLVELQPRAESEPPIEAVPEPEPEIAVVPEPEPAIGAWSLLLVAPTEAVVSLAEPETVMAIACDDVLPLPFDAAVDIAPAELALDVALEEVAAPAIAAPPIVDVALAPAERAIDVALAPATIEEETLWVPIDLQEACEEPAPVVDDTVWVLTAVPDMADLLAAAAPRSIETPVIPTPIEEAPAVEPLAIAALSAPEPPVELPTPKTPKKKAAKAQPKKPKPVQDEWGFFDPEQCGFAALLAKLDEITDDHHEDDHTPETTVRVIGY